MNIAPNISYIPADTPFLATLARRIMRQYGQDAAGLTRVLVLLPNRRACRALRHAFLEESGGKPLLLPRIQAIGDVDEDTLLMTSWVPALPADTPSAMPSVRRELRLTCLIHGFAGVRFDWDQSAQLARQLAQWLDDVGREEVSMNRLQTLVPDEWAKHWQETLAFLSIVSQQWPKVLQEEGAMDPAAHRSLVLRAVAAAWQAAPPDFPVIAAGSTGSIPATAKLLSVIARLPQGEVILPGLDATMNDTAWDALGETHPQYGMKQWIDLAGKREGVKRLAEADSLGAPSARIALLREVFAAAQTTSEWAQTDALSEEGVSGIRLLTAATQHDEARMIAVVLREALESPGKTAALVTPDRALARMVAAQMQRFGIAVDDSAGQPLADTPVGCFLRLILEVAASKAGAVELLSLLRHPLTAVGLEPSACRRLSRELEKEFLRGVRFAPGLNALCDATKANPTLHAWMIRLMRMLQPLMECFERHEVSLHEALLAHMQVAEALAQTTDIAGEGRLWAKDSGQAMAEFFAEVLPHADLLGPIAPADYPALWLWLLAPKIIRAGYGAHPRLHILSPLEARLQHFDRVILGGLNEGSWPALASVDPWMSRPMRAAFGLPSPERAVGQSAHDVWMLCAGPEVFLSRARKVDGVPTVASRWLVRLQTLVGGLYPELWARMDASAHYAQGAHVLDAPEAMPEAARPAPTPPRAARPRQLRVTAVDRWFDDPYQIYARYILRLRCLDALDAEPDAADLGNVIHKALEQFAQRYPAVLPDQPLAALLECGKVAFAEMMARPAVAVLWWPRFVSVAHWVVAREHERRGTIVRVLAEVKGRWEWMVGDRPFVLTTRMDRIEMRRDGTLAIIDYKTGALPSDADIKNGRANQLLLEACLLREGGVETAALQAIKTDSLALEYWKLAGTADQCAIKAVSAEGITAAKSRLEQWIRYFDNEEVPYAPPGDHADNAAFNDYAHLTRRQEWESV